MKNTLTYSIGYVVKIKDRFKTENMSVRNVRCVLKAYSKNIT